MKSITTLIQQINSLPKGNVYKKVIKNRIYYYHQYFELGKRISKKIDIREKDQLEKQIAERQMLEKELKLLQAQNKGLSFLSDSARKLTGYVMSEDKIVAEYQEGELIRIDIKRAPLIIKRTHSLVAFLKTRVIDTTRVNSRLLKKALSIHEEDDSLLSLYAYGQSISDNYWFKPKHSKMRFKDICFNNDIYSDIALKGDTSYFPSRHKITPELTTVGSFEKGWKKVDSHWWLYKNGTKNEIFSELFCSKFAKLMEVETVEYFREEEYIKCQNFAEEYNYEPLVSIAGDDDRYGHTFNVLNEIRNDIAKDFLKLLIFDCVINNIDRHNENCGLLRDKKRGDIIKLAPNFDNNLALISRNSVLHAPNQDGFIKLFVDFLKKNETAKKTYQKISFVEITKEDILRIINEIDFDIPIGFDLAKSVYQRYNYLTKLKI